MKSPNSVTTLAATLLLAGCSLTVPMGPDRPQLADTAAPTKPGVELMVMPLVMGRSTAPRCVPAGELTCRTAIDIVHTAILVQHPKATFVVDAGLGTRSKEDLGRFSFVVRNLFGYRQERSLAESLAAMERAGWPRPELFVITHAHWDHTSGLLDVVRPRVLLGPGEAEFVRAFPADKPPTVMPHHLAGAALETFTWDGPAFETFPSSHDLFGDGAVVLVPLPGHTPGSLGIFLSSVRGRRVFLIGDAAWSRDAFEHPSHKLAPLSELVDNEPARLSDTLWRLHHLAARYPALLIVPSHDARAIGELRDLATTPDRR